MLLDQSVDQLKDRQAAEIEDQLQLCCVICPRFSIYSTHNFPNQSNYETAMLENGDDPSLKWFLIQGKRPLDGGSFNRDTVAFEKTILFIAFVLRTKQYFSIHVTYCYYIFSGVPTQAVLMILEQSLLL